MAWAEQVKRAASSADEAPHAGWPCVLLRFKRPADHFDRGDWVGVSEYGAGRDTVLRALGLLREAGLIFTVRSGSYVTPRETAGRPQARNGEPASG